ncbi:MAG: SAM-dependent methyltransferase, partial [Pseudomonadota bacterium]
LEELGRSKATLAIHLSIRNLAYIREALAPHYGDDCPVIIAYRATWPDELYLRTTLADMREDVRKHKITRTALVLVGAVFGEVEFRDSDLYNEGFSHVLRNRGKKVKA